MTGVAAAVDGAAAVRRAFDRQALACDELGSPFTAMLCRLLASGLDRSTAIGRRILDWQGDPDGWADALPLRLSGGLHGLVRRGRLPRLAEHYPPHPLPDAATLWPLVAAALAEAGPELEPWLASPPQTNEVGRSAVLMAGLLVIAHRTGLPLQLLELGASAGLNLVLDRYRYRLGSERIGPEASSLCLAPLWEGSSPPRATLRIQHRRGVDLNPVDLTSVADRERLVAYVWPDQVDRLARVEAAIAIAAAAPPPIDRGDAAGWLESQLSEPTETGVARVVMHSIAFQYFPVATQRRITAMVTRAGLAATDRRPLAWLHYEMTPEDGTLPALRLRLWPSGSQDLLAVGSPHGMAVTWLHGAAPGPGQWRGRS